MAPVFLKLSLKAIRHLQKICFCPLFFLAVLVIGSGIPRGICASDYISQYAYKRVLDYDPMDQILRIKIAGALICCDRLEDARAHLEIAVKKGSRLLIWEPIGILGALYSCATQAFYP